MSPSTSPNLVVDAASSSVKTIFDSLPIPTVKPEIALVAVLCIVFVFFVFIWWNFLRNVHE